MTADPTLDEELPPGKPVSGRVLAVVLVVAVIVVTLVVRHYGA